jgi:AcrR family transcriptional regulator
MASKLRDRIREATSDAILAAAEEVFADKGIHSAKVDEIAAQAGVSVGTLYNYFPDREGLLCSLLDVRKGEIIVRIDEAFARTVDQPFEAQLLAFIESIFQYFDEHRLFFTILFQGEVQKGLPAGAAGPRETMRALYERTSALVQRGIAEGVVRPEGSDLLPGILTGMVRSALIIRLYDPSLSRLIDRTADFARFFMQGAGARRE